MISQAPVPPIGLARERELLRNAVSYVYREPDGPPLHAHFFFPPEFSPADRRPVIVFFHGGFWEQPAYTQFVPHCNHFASRGAIAITAETRLASTHASGPLEAIDDARSLLLWLKVHADRFGTDPARLVAAGAAGGALLALAAAMPKDLPATGPLDCRPRALVLFSPLVDTTPKRGRPDRFPNPKAAKETSPSEHVRKGLPPSILFHGKSDRLVPFASVERFAKRMRRKRNTCQLIPFENAEHPFFNFNVNETNFELTLAAADRFLVEQNILPPPPADLF
jgi:acetyl esterase/lipase